MHASPRIGDKDHYMDSKTIETPKRQKNVHLITAVPHTIILFNRLATELQS